MSDSGCFSYIAFLDFENLLTPWTMYSCCEDFVSWCVIAWFTSCLSNHKQHVKCNGKFSFGVQSMAGLLRAVFEAFADSDLC